MFGRSRVAVELLLTGLRESLRESYGPRSRVRQGADQRFVPGGTFRCAVQKPVRELFKTLKAQEGAAHHKQRCDRPGREGTDGQRRRNQNSLVDERALGHGPHHGQFAVGFHARDLLRIERQVVTQHASRFLGCDFGQQGHVVQYAGDVIDQGKQAGGHILRNSSINK